MALAVAAGAGPWFFGAWEMWWFWPFAAVIAAAVAVGGLLLVLSPELASAPAVRQAVLPLLLMVPFLAYAVIRGLMSPVYMDAERIVLLHLSGVAVAVLTAFCLTPLQRRVLFSVLFCSLAVMAVYGVVNHLVNGSRLVLWAPRYEQYAGRATGPYYCPDHFSGAMELLFCMCAGVLLDRTRRGVWLRGLAAIAGGLAVTAILLSESRGGGLTLMVLFGCILVWGFVQWPRAIGWYWRMITVSAVLLLAIASLFAYPSYFKRFVEYAGLHHVKVGSDRSLSAEVLDRLRRDSRGRMFGGAWRAWQSAPWAGIGPGMHQHLWPRFAATPDGDRELGVWPTLVNDDFHSYEVHNDWLQQLEEFGVVGTLLFLVPFLALCLCLCRGARFESRCWGSTPTGPSDGGGYVYLLSGGLALAAMSFHSLGDFNLQMPGTVWLLAALLGCAVASGACQMKTEESFAATSDEDS